MRLADSSVLTLEEKAFVPPLEVRLGLEAGDRVALYELVRHPSMGEGVSPIYATVLGSHEPGWFIGQADDGAEIEFHADQVLDVDPGSPSMQGLMPDWLRNLAAQAPGKGGGTQLPMLPEEKQLSYWQRIKQAASGLPIERPSSELSPEGPGSRAMAIFKKAMAPFLEVVRAVREAAPAKKEVKPVDPTKLDIFEAVSQNRFEAFKKNEILPRKKAIPQQLPKDVQRYVKVLPLPPRSSLLPSVEEMARGFATWYDLDDLWEMIRKAKEDPLWKEELESEGVAKFPMDSIGSGSGVRPTPEEELAAFFNIPWSEFEKLMDVEQYEYRGRIHEELIFGDEFHDKIILPTYDLVYEAFELLKPPDLPGHVVISWDEDMEGMAVILYFEEDKEAKKRLEKESEDAFSRAMEEEKEEEEEEAEEEIEEPKVEEVKIEPEKKKKSKKKKG